MDPEIAQLELRGGMKIDIAENAGEAEHVLVFEVRAIGVLVNFDGEEVFAWLKVGCEIELSGRAGVLGVADFFAIEPEVECGINAAEDEEGVAIFPIVRQGKAGAVGADLVAIFFGEIGEMSRRHAHHEGRVFCERIDDVGVERGAVTVKLPVRGYGDFFP